MRQFRLVVGIMGVISCFITIFLYYYHHDTMHGHRLRLIQKVETTTKKQDYETINNQTLKLLNNESKSKNSNETVPEDTENVIDTTGCQIPVAEIQYDKYIVSQKNTATCKKRAVYLKRNIDETIRIVIKPNLLKRYLRRSARYFCCYRFIYTLMYENVDIEYSTRKKKNYKFSPCQRINDRDNITLESDFVNVKCSEYGSRNKTYEIYDDIYAFTRRIDLSSSTTQRRNSTCNKNKFNVLMIGMDSMSLPRFTRTMPLTSEYFKENSWLRFQGYNKVGDNTFPNLMAAFTGQNMTKLKEKCSENMDECNNDIIWSQFQENGYVTAYGEDYVKLPDTFSNEFAFKRVKPTDHYMRPMFLAGEEYLNNQQMVCTQKKSSGLHLLDYLLDFVLTYKTDPFFGVFWINSFSHNENSRPEDADRMFLNFFNRLSSTGVLNKTFVIFFSDHGIRFGKHRLLMESYYDDRNPLLFISVPLLYRINHDLQYKALSINQFRLVTPYDLYNTLTEINRVSSCQNCISYSEACPKCHSLFKKVSANRTCTDAAIERKWCSCHKLLPLSSQDVEGIKSVIAVTSFIKSIVKSIKTKHCWGCMNLSLHSVIRMHYYYDIKDNQLYHVVAFNTKPGNLSFEATLLRSDEKIEIVGSVSSLSPYRNRRKCTLSNSKTYRKDRLYCICQKKENCHF